MMPAFRPLERVLTYNWGSLQKGSVVVFKNKEKIFIKRVVKIDKGKIYVSGDNKKLSSKVEPFTLDKLIGRVFLKY